MTHKKSTSLFALIAFVILIGCMGPKHVEVGNEAYRAGDMATAHQSYQLGVEGGDPDAMHAMALMYAEGQGVPQDGAKAVELMKTAVEQGSYQAATSLGVCAYYGFFMPQDYEVAASYFAYAAVEGGDYLAIEYLYDMYNNGIGVEKDPEMAVFFESFAPVP